MSRRLPRGARTASGSEDSGSTSECACGAATSGAVTTRPTAMPRRTSGHTRIILSSARTSRGRTGGGAMRTSCSSSSTVHLRLPPIPDSDMEPSDRGSARRRRATTQPRGDVQDVSFEVATLAKCSNWSSEGSGMFTSARTSARSFSRTTRRSAAALIPSKTKRIWKAAD